MNARAPRAGLTRSVLAIVALAVLVALPATAPPPVDAASLRDQIAAARKRQTDLARSIQRQEALLRTLSREQASTAAAIRDTSRQLDSIQRDQVTVRRKIEQAVARLKRLQARHASLVEELRQTDWTLGLLEQELASGEEDLRARREALGQRLAEAYRTENTSLLEQVFTAESFSDVLSQTSAYLAYGDQDAQMAQEIAEDQQAIDALRSLTTSTRLRTDQLRRATIATQELIRARKAELKAAQKRLRALERQTKSIQARQKARYRQLVHNKRQAEQARRQQVAARSALQRRIGGLVRRAKALAARRAAARAAAARRASRRSGGGSGGGRSGGGGIFMWPASGTITGNYGCSSFRWYPVRNGCHWHDGIDIANGTGTRIRAAGDGVVAYVGYRTDGAFVVVIGHANGLETTYAHLLPRYAVRSGQYVKRGRTIGYMGCTGFCTGTHLHWEVSRNFVTLNPRSYL